MIAKDEKRNTWFVQVKVKDPLTGKWHTHKKRGFATKREAKQYEAKYLSPSEKRSAFVGSFKDVSERYLDSIQASDESRQMHRARFKRSFESLYDLPITKITRQMLEAWRIDLINSDYAFNTKMRTLQYVRSVFHYAAQIYGIPDPSIVLKPIRKPLESPDERMHTWTVEQFNTFLSAVDNPLYALFYETLYWTGMRRGECLALQKSDFDGKRLTVHASIKHFKNGLKTPKNASSIRSIAIDDKLAADLMPLMDVPGPFLFGGDRSLSINSVQQYFTQAIKDSGVPPIRLHDLRHSHATLLINNGVNIVAVSKRLGHASIEQTLKTYTHLLQKTDDAMMDAISKLHE
ncbi:MAG: site-specific integrase [Erysipelotrichaceae bacterium]|nr:site-specific integrase [Lactimicrobium massiliense]MDD6257899.1 site-specific integrase [Erysipelotrichaceae bacterium]MDD6561350.1 site-specific integrase [Lactimicrobium massiliense]